MRVCGQTPGPRWSDICPLEGEDAKHAEASGFVRSPCSGLFAASVGDCALAAKMLKREPPMGALKPGERVLVDDSSCPKGQIREVIGGDHYKVGGRNAAERQRRCIAR